MSFFYVTSLICYFFIKNSFEPQSLGEYILFRDVEHCGISSAPGTSSVQFRELDHHSMQQIYSLLTEFRQIAGISGNS